MTMHFSMYPATYNPAKVVFIGRGSFTDCDGTRVVDSDDLFLMIQASGITHEFEQPRLGMGVLVTKDAASQIVKFLERQGWQRDKSDV